ncbi:hypothetical protein SCUP515_09395 [Seiridium cupressi]
MASGFDRLEKFFGASRRREKASQEKTVVTRNAISMHAPYRRPGAREKSPFPSPSFLKPTSTRMQPRDPKYQRPEEEGQMVKDKARSRSLPDVKKSLRGHCPAFNSLEMERKTRSYESSRPSSITDSPSTPQLPGFRFPEDSLFRSPETPTTSAETSPRHIKNEAAFDTPKQEAGDHKLLDWSPRQLSLMFDSNELRSINEQLGLDPRNDAQESIVLMPSPMFVAPERPPPKSPLRAKRPRTLATRRSQELSKVQDWTFSKFPKQYSVISSSTCQTYSPPTSDSEDGYSPRATAHSRPASRYETPDIYSADSSPKLSPKARLTEGYGRAGLRETWGIRCGDPKLGFAEPGGDLIPRSCLKKTESAATLSAANSKISQERILQEPTIDDIYALSDDDIFEARPFSPRPPTPPPKDDIPLHIRRRTPTQNATQLQRSHVVSLKSGVVTPPETPTDLQFLIPLPASHSSGELGAIMAAGIAKKYNFDLIYLVSLWPSGAGNHLDPSLHLTPRSAQHSTAHGGSIYASPNSKITGRYLAAFGLNQFGQPFQMHTKVLLKALRTQGWNEYDDPTTPLNHGWACSFNSDCVPLEQQGVDAKVSRSSANCGIVFAAYTRQNDRSLIPREYARKEDFLTTLHADVARLVDILLAKK